MELKEINNSDIIKVIDKDYNILSSDFKRLLGRDNPFAEMIETTDSVIWCADGEWTPITEANIDDQTAIHDKLNEAKVLSYNKLGSDIDKIFTYPDDDYVFFSKINGALQIIIAGWGYRRNPDAIVEKPEDKELTQSVAVVAAEETSVTQDTEAIQYIYCTECGTRARVGMAYCTNCGMKLHVMSSAPTSAPVSAPVVPVQPIQTPQQDYQPQQDYEPEEKKTNWLMIIAVTIISLVVVGAIAFFVINYMDSKKGHNVEDEEDTELSQQDFERSDENYMKEGEKIGGYVCWVMDSIKSDKYSDLISTINSGELTSIDMFAYNKLPDDWRNIYWDDIINYVHKVTDPDGMKIIRQGLDHGIFHIQEVATMLKQTYKSQQQAIADSIQQAEAERNSTEYEEPAYESGDGSETQPAEDF